MKFYAMIFYNISGELFAERMIEFIDPLNLIPDNAGAGSQSINFSLEKRKKFIFTGGLIFMPSKHSSTIIMIEGALCIALSIVLSKINLFEMPQGGSVDFELVPIILFAYRRGLKWGTRAGALLGVVKILLGAYFFNVIQVLLDYPLAYAFAGLCAIHPAILGLILAAIGQISCSIISGAVFFAQYAPEGQNPWVYSFFYNTPVLGVKYILSGIVALFLWKVLERELPVQN